jgi:hypothetical protein
LASAFGCHAIIIAPDRRARLRLSHSWSLLGQSDSPISDVRFWEFCSRWTAAHRGCDIHCRR